MINYFEKSIKRKEEKKMATKDKNFKKEDKEPKR